MGAIYVPGEIGDINHLRRELDRSAAAALPLRRLLPPPPVETPTIVLGAASAASLVTGGTLITLYPVYGNPPSANYRTDLFAYDGGTVKRADWTPETDTYAGTPAYALTGVRNGNITKWTATGDRGALAVEFWTDAPDWEGMLQTYAANALWWRLWIDGVPQTQDANGPLASGGANYRLRVTHASRRLRHYRVEIAGGYWRGVTCTTVDVVRAAPRPRRRRVVAVGDSITNGSGAAIAGNNGTFQWRSWAVLLGQMQGVELIPSGIGGTGLINPGASQVGIARYATDVAALSPDSVIHAWGTNDTTYTSAERLTALRAYGAAAMAQTPTAKHYLVTNFYFTSSPTAGMAQTRLDILTVAAELAAAYPQAVWGVIDIDGLFRAGSDATNGYTATATNAVAPDGGHPSPQGHLDIALHADRTLILNGWTL